MSKKDYSRIIKGIINGSLKWNSAEYSALRELIFSISRTILGNPGYDELEEIESEFLYRIFEYKDRFLDAKFISQNYIRKMVKNIIVDLYSKKERVFSEFEVENKDGKVFTLEDFVGVEDTNRLMVEVEQALERIRAVLKEKDYEVLCYYVLKKLHGVKIEISISEDNLHKRWERLKKRIEPIFADMSQKEQEYLVRKLSDFCKEAGY